MSAAVSRPSRVGRLFLSLFALPFIGIGLFVLVTAARSEAHSAARVIPLIIGAVFLLAGLALLATARAGLRRANEIAALSKQYPNEPWLWREDWSRGVIASSNRARAIGMIAFAAIWNLISFTIFALAFGEIAADDGAAWLVVIFPIIGVGLAAWAVREWLVWRRYGTSVFQLAAIPGVLGGRVAGVVKLSDSARHVETFEVSLLCHETRNRRSGGRRETESTLIWSEKKHLVATQLPETYEGIAIPVLFAAPYDQPQTNFLAGAGAIKWTIVVQGKQPGVDIDVEFEIPVFETTESRADFKLDDSALKPYVESTSNPLVDTTRIEVERLNDRISCYFPPGANKSGALFMVVAAAVFGTGAHFIRVADGPLILTIIFTAVPVLLLWFAFDAMFGSARIEVDPQTLRWMSRGLFGSKERELQRSAVASVEIFEAGSAGSQIFYYIRIVRRDGRSALIGRRIGGRQLAEQLAADIAQMLRLTPHE